MVEPNRRPSGSLADHQSTDSDDFLLAFAAAAAAARPKLSHRTLKRTNNTIAPAPDPENRTNTQKTTQQVTSVFDEQSVKL